MLARLVLGSGDKMDSENKFWIILSPGEGLPRFFPSSDPTRVGATDTGNALFYASEGHVESYVQTWTVCPAHVLQMKELPDKPSRRFVTNAI